ncbi:hypothetical protein RAAC3_TM7C00001G0444 [Candidatus Saccharibacteria bacterium RAAC3_TM7_1]|nr:hypothetical protein RAAC3_TM7C00001G0444 [Candidatus Saccharibacteria bacterium RAAC3_TM7_1]
MNKTAYPQAKYLSLKEIQSMTNDDVIKYVYSQHKETGVSIEDFWQEQYNDFEKQTMNGIRGSESDSWNNNKNFESDSRFMQIGIVYAIVFLIIWFIFEQLVKNEVNTLGFALAVSGFASILITTLFMNVSGKNEKNYFDASNKLQHAYLVFLNKGFNAVSGKPLDYTKVDKLLRKRS